MRFLVVHSLFTASDKADASVQEMLARFSQGDGGRYTVNGVRGKVNGGDGIAIDRIEPNTKALPNAVVAGSDTKAKLRDGALLQEGFVDSADRDFIYSSIAVDSRGNIGIGCTGTSQTEYPSVYVMMRAASDPANIMRDPVPAVPGSTDYK